MLMLLKKPDSTTSRPQASPVTESNGPTGLIPGSNRWTRSEFLFRVHKGLDRVTGERYGPYAGGSEYRVTARSPELRASIEAKPRTLLVLRRSG